MALAGHQCLSGGSLYWIQPKDASREEILAVLKDEQFGVLLEGGAPDQMVVGEVRGRLYEI